MKLMTFCPIIYLILLLLCIFAKANPQDDAINAVLSATYEQIGLKKDVEDYGKCLEKRYVKKEQEKYWAVLTYIANSLAHNEITVRITF